jgi:simple sugar transport system permease protein
VQTGSVWLAILVAIAAGAVMSAVVALMSITLRVSQIVTGLGVVLFGIGLSSFIGRTGDPPLHGQSASATITPFLDSGPADWPVVGPILLGHDFVVYVTWIFAALASWYLFKTRTGLATRAVGEDPASADAAGVRVAAVRYAHVLIGGAAAGFGGAYFTLALIPSWQDEITAGAGWIAIAIVIIARWRPWRALLAAYVFGAATRLGLTLQILNVSISPQLLSMIPFLLAIAAVLLSSIARSRGGSAPASLARPYFREER